MTDPSDGAASPAGPEPALYVYLVDRFYEVSTILDQQSSTLAVDPLLAELATSLDRQQDSTEVKRAVLFALDSRELSGAAEIIQYFACRFRWAWLKREVEVRYLDRVTHVDYKLIRHFERMLEAFSPDWEDRDLFPSLEA